MLVRELKFDNQTRKRTGLVSVLPLPAKRAGQAGRVMSTCRPPARLFLSPSSAPSIKCGPALSVVKGQGRNKLLSLLTVRHWSFQSRFQLREVSLLVKGEFLLFQLLQLTIILPVWNQFWPTWSLLTRYLNNFYILTGKTNSIKNYNSLF